MDSRRGKTFLRRTAGAVGLVLFAGLPAPALGDNLAAELSYPTAGATITDLSQPFRSTLVAPAQSYLLVIGSAAGQADVWISGDLNGTSVLVPRNLARGRQFYARIWTRAYGVLRRSSDVPFTVVDPVARPRVVSGPPLSPIPRTARTSMESAASMVYPAPGDSDVNFDQPFSWTEVAGALSYQLLVGTAPGWGDIFNSGETPRTTAALPVLPAGSYCGRIATNVAGQKTFRDFLFGSSGNPAATIRSPANGSVLSTGRTVFSWDPVPSAAGYRLVIGTTSGESNVADSGIIAESSFEIASLPADGPVYARLFTSKWDGWRFTDAAFSTSSHRPTIVTPLDGATSVDAGIPFEWQSLQPRASYRLQIGTWPGSNNLHDSGEIWVTKRFVGPLPTGQRLYGTLSAHVGQVWTPVDFRFTVGTNSPTAPRVVPAALWATDFVRGMADEGNFPFPNTPLASLLAAEGSTQALCVDYASVLLSTLQQMNVTQPARYLNVCLKPNSYDGHTLVEFQEPGGTWMILDPTFDLTVRRAAGGQWATAADVSRATAAMSFSDVSYVFLGSRGDSVAKGYYLDYPLLYLVVCPPSGCPATGPTSMPYMEPVTMPVDSGGLYAIQGVPEGSVRAMVDGAEVELFCDPVDALTYVFWAESIAPLPGSPIQVFKPRRFVF